MGKLIYLVDTCSFVEQFNDTDCADLMDKLISRGQFALSAIVAMELYAGTRDQKAKRALDTLGTKLNEAGLLATPKFSDYQKAGVVLRNYTRRKGAVKSSTHFRDILICLGAVAVNASIITENSADFLRWADEIKRYFHRGLNIHSWREFV